MKNLAVLGSTGSIGVSTLSLVADYPSEFNVVALAAGSNHELLAEQVERFRPQLVAVSNPEAAAALREKVRGIPILEGEEGVIAAAVHPQADFVLSAIVGFAGLRPTMAAVSEGKTIGLANKETLVVAGAEFMREAQRSGARILPVDSEHSAIFQCIEGRRAESIRKIILTASGGPFCGRSFAQLEGITPADALKHPSWSMGRKITIDSATLMNKGLEVIEAHYLFDMPGDRIDVVVHPQSIIHSMVEFLDGSVIAQLSVPDMRGAIAYALSYPGRLDGVIPPVDFPALGSLTFQAPDRESFPCLAYAFEALRIGGAMPAVVNAANEVAVEAFLDGRIGFTRIPAIIKETMASLNDSAGSMTGSMAGSLERMIAAHGQAEQVARGLI